MMRTQLLFLLLLSSLALSPAGAQIVPDWSAQTHPPVPLMPATFIEPVLTRDDVTDDHAAFVADPFLMHEPPGPWHLFFEVASNSLGRGRIGHATSPDGIHWTYDRIVLTEGFHLAYPYVFKYAGDYHMIVFDPTNEAILLYKAYDYPYDWRREALLVAGRPFADPSIILRNGIWYMFVGRSSGGECWLYWSSHLTTGWLEHPASPIVRDFGKARPAGRHFEFGGRLVRLAQKNDVHYGEAVRAFEVDALTPTRYAEHEIPESPILRASGEGWNRGGMHTCDAWWDGDHWIAAVDGVGDAWAIGIYRSATASGIEGGDGSADPVRIDLGESFPNPFGTSTEIRIRAGGGPVSETSPRLEIYDAAGRFVRSLEMTGSAGAIVRVSWNGTDDRGRPAAPGTYFYRMEPPLRSNTGRMVIVR